MDICYGDLPLLTLVSKTRRLEGHLVDKCRQPERGSVDSLPAPGTEVSACINSGSRGDSEVYGSLWKMKHGVLDMFSDN